MFLGAINPVGGALVTLGGSLLIALAAFFAHAERRVVVYRLSVFVLIGVGSLALWALTPVGGFGGASGYSMWRGAAVVPILLGWSMGIWGPGSPRWLLWLGIVVGLWYLAILLITLRFPGRGMGALPGIVLGITGIITIAGSIARLSRRIPRRE